MNNIKKGLTRQLQIAVVIVLLLIINSQLIYAQTSQIDISLTSEELEWIAEHPVIRAANEPDYAPIVFENNGQADGFSVDYLNLVANKVGLKIDYINGHTGEEQLEMLKSKEIDLSSTVIQTLRRDEFLNFTLPYLNMPIGYYGRVGSDRINTLEDLKGKKIGVVRGRLSAEVYKFIYPDLTLVELDNSLDILNAISAGTVDVFANTLPVTNYLISRNFISGLEVVGYNFDLEIPNNVSFSMAIRKDWPTLISILEKGMAAVSEQEYLEMSDKWQMEYQPEDIIALNDEELEWISEHPVLRVTNQPNFAPIDFVRDGQSAGFSIEYLNLIAEKTGFTVEYIDEYVWDTQLEMLRSKELDLAHTIVKTAEREKFLNFTSPYLSMPNVFYGRIGSDRINTIQDLEGKKIGAVRGWPSTAVYKSKYPQLTLIEHDSPLEVLNGISAGTIDVFVSNPPITDYMISKNFIPGLEIVGNQFLLDISNQDLFYFAVRDDWPILVNILEKGMAAVNEAEYLEISNKWQSGYKVEKDIGLSPEELEWLSNNKIIDVGVDTSAIPIEFINQEGEISGIAGAYLAKISSLLNIKFQWNGSQYFNEAINDIKTGKADIMSAITPTDERSQYLKFTDNYITTSYMLFARSGEDRFNNLDGLIGRKISQIRNFAIVEIIRKNYPGIEIVEVNSMAEALRLVTTGEVDAYIGNIITASYYMADEGLNQISVIGETPFKLEVAIGIRDDLPLLASALQKALQSISPGEKTEISREWQSLKIETQEKFEFINELIAATAIIVALIIIRIYHMRREIKKRKLSEIETSKREKQFRQILEVSPIAISISLDDQLEDDGVVQLANQRLLDMVGITEAEIGVINTSAFIDKDEKWAKLEEMIRKGDSKSNIEQVLIKKNGQKVNTLLSISSIKYKGRDCALSWFYDITEIKHAEKVLIESEKSFRSILENSPIAVAISLDDQTEDDGLILFANQKLMDLTGFDQIDIGIISTSDFLKKSEIHSGHEVQLDQGKSIWNEEQLITHKDGTELYTLMSLSPLNYQGEKAALIWFYDVNYLKETEEALKIARNEAQEAGEAKSRFLANMSHEIRTPMNAILGFTDIILLDQNLSKEHRSNLEIVNRSGAHLLSLINDVLDMSKIEADQLQTVLSEFDPALIFNDLELLFQIQMADKDLEFSVELDDTIPKLIISDKRRIRQILINLTGNSLKFTNQGGIHISGKAVPQNDKSIMLEIDIRDTGSGIAPNDHDRVFEAFEQTDDGIKEGHGTGLGLPLSRRLARELGGDITLTSQLKEGATFHVSLLVEETIANEEDLSISENEIIGIIETDKKPRILIADDISENRLYLKTLLEGVGFTTKSCNDGKQATVLAEQWSPDIILMDAIMPVMNGREAIKRIRSNSLTKDIPIIVISASILEDDIKDVLQVGANAFLAKPVMRKELLIAIQQQITLEYEYSEKENSQEIRNIRKSNTNNQITSELLPAELIQKLQRAADTLDITEMELLLKEVSQHDSQLGERMNTLIDEFEWQEIELILSS